MRRICVMPRCFSLILLTFILSVMLIACSTHEGKNQQEAKPSTIPQELAEEVEQPEIKTKELTISGLDFNSAPDDVVKQLGNPSDITSAPGVSVYYYGEGYHKGVTICFIEDKAISFRFGKAI